jgi:glycosyltransferase involved in cell wall biosynthesis
MRIVFVDDSAVYDGYSPPAQPLDGPERALAHLSTALAMRGHEVVVINRAAFPVTVNGARWVTWLGDRPSDADVIVAFRRAELLDTLPAQRHVLWAVGPAALLREPVASAALIKHRARVVFLNKAQLEAWTDGLGLSASVIEPGIAPSFLDDEPMAPADPPAAVTTVHPLGGLDWLLKLWTARIRPEAPTAELHVYSNLLDRAQLGGGIAPEYAPIFDQVTAARAHGVMAKRPQAEPGMAEAYRKARAYLQPGAGRHGFALADAQATGLPAVARAGATVAERIVDRETGVIAATDAAFAHATLDLLTDRVAFERMSANARLLKRGRTWAIAAAEWEEALG